MPSNDPASKSEPIVNLASFIQTLADAESSQVVNPLAHVFDSSHRDFADLAPLPPPPPPSSSDPSAFMHHRDLDSTSGFPDPPASSFSLDTYEDEDANRQSHDDDHHHHHPRGVLDDENRRVLEDGEIEGQDHYDGEEEEEEEEDATTPRRDQNITPKRRQFNVSESMYKSVLVHSASKRFQESLMEEMRKEDEMSDAAAHQFQQEAEAEAEAAAEAEAETKNDELPEELVDSLGMISLANAAEMHREQPQQQQQQQQPLPPASTLLNLSSSFVVPENVFPSSSTMTTSASSETTTTNNNTTTASFANPIEVVTSGSTVGVNADSQQSLAAQMTHLANYSYSMGNLPSTAFDYLRLYDSQILNNSTSAADGSGNHDQNAFPANDFYDFQS